MATDAAATKKRPRGDLLASLDAAFAAKPTAPTSKYTAQAAQAQAQANSQQAYLHTKRKKKSKGKSGAPAAAPVVRGGAGTQQPTLQQQQQQQQPQQPQQPTDPLYGKLSVDLLRVGLKNCSLLPQAKTFSRQYVLSATLKSYLDAATQSGGKSVDAAAADKLKNKVLQLDNPVKTTDKTKIALGKAQTQAAKLLSARRRRQLGLHLLKGEMPFSDAEQLCAIWRRYARDVLAVDGGDPAADDVAQNLRLQAKFKALELSGCPVEVVRSQNPCVVGVSGIVVSEKQRVLQLCTPANKIITLPKLGSRFRVALDDTRAVLVEGAWLQQRSN